MLRLAADRTPEIAILVSNRPGEHLAQACDVVVSDIDDALQMAARSEHVFLGRLVDLPDARDDSFAQLAKPIQRGLRGYRHGGSGGESLNSGDQELGLERFDDPALRTGFFRTFDQAG